MMMNEMFENNLLETAINEKSVLTFTYNKNDLSSTERRVMPVEILDDVLVAIDLDKDGYRRFHVSQMENVRIED